MTPVVTQTISNTVLFLTPIEWLQENTVLRRLGTLADNYLDLLPVPYSIRAFITKKEGNTYTAQLVPTTRDVSWTLVKVMSVAYFFTGTSTAFIPLIALGLKILTRVGVTIQAFEVSPMAFSDKANVVILVTRQFKSPTASEKDSRYAEIFRKKGLDYAKATALQKHVAAFADDDGNITQASIEHQLVRMKMGYYFSKFWAFGVYNIYKSAEGIQIKHIHQAKQLHDSQIFNDQGQVENSKLAILKKFAKTDPTLLTVKEIASLCASFVEQKSSYSNCVTTYIKLESMLLMFTDRVIVDAFGNSFDAISIDTLEKLYKYGPFLFDQLAEMNNG